MMLVWMTWEAAATALDLTKPEVVRLAWERQWPMTARGVCVPVPQVAPLRRQLRRAA